MFVYCIIVAWTVDNVRPHAPSSGLIVSSESFSSLQVWNHPWVLKLDEDRQMLKAERAAILYGLSDDDETLGGFIVESSDETSSNSSTARKKKIKV